MSDPINEKIPGGIAVLKLDEIQELENRTHFSQKYLCEKFGVPIEEIYALPTPYMGVLQEITINLNPSGKYNKGCADGKLFISQEDPYFWCHFLGDPVMPGSQGLDGFMQLAGCWAGATGKIFGRARALTGEFKFYKQILPTSKVVHFHVDVQRFLPNKKLIYFDGYMALEKEDNIIYEFKNCSAGFFTSQELDLPSRDPRDYYQPDWEKIKKDMLDRIEKAQKYYASLK